MQSGAEITAYASQTDKSNVGMATIADERLERLAELVGAKKVTPAAIRVQDAPGTGPALLGGLRQVDALLAVADGFSGTADPESDIETLKLGKRFGSNDKASKEDVAENLKETNAYDLAHPQAAAGQEHAARVGPRHRLAGGGPRRTPPGSAPSGRRWHRPAARSWRRAIRESRRARRT
mgnify:CR=1 FL=1